MSRKKFILVVPDGLTEKPWGDFQTPLELARTPNLDRLSRMGTVGFVKTIPSGFHPGSEIGNMVLLGYDPSSHYTGRGPIEAASLGIEMEKDDVVFRCNLVTLTPYGNHVVMEDYSAGHIEDEDAEKIVEDLNRFVARNGIRFYKGKSYRNLMVWKKSPSRPDEVESVKLPPPHDIVGRSIFQFIEGFSKEILKLITQSQLLLKNHPVNVKRRNEGKKEANSIWLWGQGRKPSFKPFKELYGRDGAVISAVDVVKGLGRLSGLEVVEVEGATGYYDTNYEGKADAALKALEEKDFVLVHIEATDEAGHSGDFELKKRVIEDFDRRFLGRLLEGLEKFQRWRMVISPDHPTPLDVRTHTDDPVPFLLVDSDSSTETERSFSERIKGVPIVEDGTDLIRILFEEKNIEN